MARTSPKSEALEPLQDAFLVGPFLGSPELAREVRPRMLKIEGVGIGKAFFPQEGEYPCLMFMARDAEGRVEQIPVGDSAYCVTDAQGSRILASAG